MNKRFILPFLLFTLFFATSCSNNGTEEEKTIYELYTQANEYLQNADSILVDTDINIELDFLGEIMEVGMKGSIAQVFKAGNDIDMKMNMVTSMLGQEFQIESYYKDGFYYLESMGEKSRVSMPIEEVMQQSNTNSFEFPETAIKSQELKELGDDKELSFTLGGSEINDLLIEQLGDLSELIGSDTDVNFSDIEFTAVIDKDNALKSTTMKFPLEMDFGGDKVSSKCSISMDVLQIGGVTIDFPEDLDSYTAMD